MRRNEGHVAGPTNLFILASRPHPARTRAALRGRAVPGSEHTYTISLHFTNSSPRSMRLIVRRNMNQARDDKQFSEPPGSLIQSSSCWLWKARTQQRPGRDSLPTVISSKCFSSHGLWGSVYKASCVLHTVSIVTKGSPIIPTLSLINPTSHIDTYFFKIHPNIVIVEKWVCKCQSL